MKITIIILLLIAGGIAQVVAQNEQKSFQYKVVKTLDISEVPSGFPVGFCLLTKGKKQYVAYYDKDRQMTVASRSLDSKKWDYQILPSKIGWDSHNYITMVLDNEGYLHLSGNMHANPLVYFRTEKPGDITTFKKFPMTGKLEKRTTYPKFMSDNNRNLLFTYRSGGSGNGINIWNKYDIKTRTWSRMLEKPLFDGERKRNAYPSAPFLGPDGLFHIIWVWRHTPDCATNHNLSYVRSKDMINWESVFGEKVELPIKISDNNLLIDPCPSGGGMINGGQRLGFDSNKNPIVFYHKSDKNGNMQIYAARPETDKWVKYLLTDWKKPVKFSGGGSMGFIGIRLGSLKRPETGLFSMTYQHRDYGNGNLLIDEKTLKPLNKKISSIPQFPKELNKVESYFKGMKIRRSGDIGSSDEENVKYILQWETLGRNRDKPRKPPLPEPSKLKLYKLSDN